MKTARPSTATGRRPDSALSRRSSAQQQEAFHEDIENILSSLIDEKYLVNASGVKDLDRIEFISLQIDSNLQSLLDLPDLLPNLRHLVLDNSSISSIRDLGVGLRGITSLSLSGCGLRDIDGVGVLQGLQELNLSDNCIADVSPLMMHENIQNLNLSGNKIADLSFGASLSTCPHLRSLFLSRNPVERVPQFRAVIAHLVPSLEMLDGAPLPAESNGKAGSASLLSNALSFLAAMEEELDDEERLENEIFALSPDPSTLSSAAAHNITVAHTAEGLPDTGSELTHGSAVVLAGNVAAAMRRRRTQAVREGDSANTSRTATIGAGKTFESALDVLDAVLLAPPSPTVQDEREKVFYREGDITETVLGSPRHHHSSQTHIKTAERARRAELAIDITNNTNHTAFSPTPAERKAAVPAPPSFEETGTLISSVKRPKSAFSGTVNRFAPVSNPQTPKRQDDVQSRPPAFSPRQKNSSRPQSAVTAAQLSGIALPFSVSLTQEKDSDDDSDTERERERDRANAQETVRARKLVALHHKEEEEKERRTASIVHMDIVKRSSATRTLAENDKLEDIEDEDTNLFISSARAQPKNLGEENDDDSDEDIAITHRERLRMMSASASNTTATLNKQRQHVLQKLKGTTTDSLAHRQAGAIEEEYGLPPLRKLSNASQNSGNSTPRRGIAVPATKNGTASKAGMSLGFNLAGSLAAIDQWVQDMSSDDEDSAEENDSKPVAVRTRPNSAFSVESLTPRGSLMKDKILSRDAIFHMCSNSSSKDTKRDSLPPSRRDSRSSVLSDEMSNDRESLSGKVISSASAPLATTENKPSKSVALSTQKAALLSKVSVGKAPALDPLWSRSNTQQAHTNTEVSFIAEDESKPAKKREKESSSSSSSSSVAANCAVHMSDSELVDLLRKPPKSVPMLRTKASFQEFFRGIEVHRFRKLLQHAYDDIADKADRESKIKRRMELMENMFS